MYRMLINATHKDEELRIALADGQKLTHFLCDIPEKHKKGNVYKAKITRKERSLNACFVDYGEGRQGFLPFKEVAYSVFKPDFKEVNRPLTIDDVVEEGQEIIVQVEKEERGAKGAALTTFISLPGSYLVLMPNNPRAGGVSRRIEGDERDQMQSAIAGLTPLPEGMGIIARTAGNGRSVEELQWDLDMLLRLWQAILDGSETRPAPFLIYQESDAVVRALRDYLRRDVESIVVDDKAVYKLVVDYLKLIRPGFDKVSLYEDSIPLFTRYQVESQIESAFQREVRLPSGGSISIDHTEALVAIDVNSAKSTKGSDIEETALTTNLEAAEEVARQCRLRDIGGLCVIDFIDMGSIRNQQLVQKCLQDAFKLDRARVQFGKISRFGLLEMSRQRLQPSLGEATQTMCPRCSGQGRIRGIKSLSLSILRILEEEALKDNSAMVQAIVPTEVAAYLCNEKRQNLSEIESRHQVRLMIVPSRHLMTPQYQITRIRQNDALTPEDVMVSSYSLDVEPEISETVVMPPAKASQEPVIKSIPVPEAPPPRPVQGQPGILTKLFKFLFDRKKRISESRAEGEAPRRSGHHLQKRRPGKFNPRHNRSHHNKRSRYDNRRGEPSASTSSLPDNKASHQHKPQGEVVHGQSLLQIIEPHKQAPVSETNVQREEQRRERVEARREHSGPRRDRDSSTHANSARSNYVAKKQEASELSAPQHAGFDTSAVDKPRELAPLRLDVKKEETKVVAPVKEERLPQNQHQPVVFSEVPEQTQEKTLRPQRQRPRYPMRPAARRKPIGEAGEDRFSKGRDDSEVSE